MLIGEVARKSGVSVETVRFYERKGLVVQPPRPASGGYRDYSPETVRRLAFIRQAQQLGFALGEIAELLDLQMGNNANCADVRRRAEAKRAEVRTRIRQLNRIGEALDALIEACPGEGPVEACSILEAIGAGTLCFKPNTDGEEHE